MVGEGRKSGGGKIGSLGKISHGAQTHFMSMCYEARFQAEKKAVFHISLKQRNVTLDISL